MDVPGFTQSLVAEIKVKTKQLSVYHLTFIEQSPINGTLNRFGIIHNLEVVITLNYRLPQNHTHTLFLQSVMMIYQCTLNVTSCQSREDRPPWRPAPLPAAWQRRPGKCSDKSDCEKHFPFIAPQFTTYCHQWQCRATDYLLGVTWISQSAARLSCDWVRSSGRRDARLRNAPYWAGSVQRAAVRQIKPNHKSCDIIITLSTKVSQYHMICAQLSYKAFTIELFTPLYSSLLESHCWKGGLTSFTRPRRPVHSSYQHRPNTKSSKSRCWKARELSQSESRAAYTLLGDRDSS